MFIAYILSLSRDKLPFSVFKHLRMRSFSRGFRRKPSRYYLPIPSIIDSLSLLRSLSDTVFSRKRLTRFSIFFLLNILFLLLLLIDVIERILFILLCCRIHIFCMNKINNCRNELMFSFCHFNIHFVML